MVAIRANEAQSFLKSIEPRINAILAYGPDAGLVAERAKDAAERLAVRDNPPGEVLRIEDADLDTDPDRIHIELQTVAMFGGAKVVRTSASRKVTAAFLKPLLEPGAIVGGIVVEAGNLRPDEALRKLFESSASAAAIPCFADETRDIESLIREALSGEQIEIAPDALQMLVARLGADRALTRAEIEKLVLYAHGAKRIEVEDVEAAVGDASELTIDTILLATSGGDGRRAVVELDRAVSSGESSQTVIVFLQRHFQRLHRLRGAIEAGKSFEEAARGLRPPLHFKMRSIIEAQCRTWDLARLDRAIAAINRAAKEARLSSYLETTLAERLVLDLARLAGQHAGRRSG
jgi:DNA polymerase-3 subunit delta